MSASESTDAIDGSAPRTERLLEVARELVSELDLETVLGKVLDAARELTGARYAALGVLDERKHELERFLYRGVSDETRRAIGSLPRGHGILGELIRDPRPLRLANIAEHPHSYGFPPGHPPMTTFLGAPVLVGGEPWGNLYLCDKAGGREFEEADEELVVLLARWASVAIDNARLHGQLVRRSAELERAVRGLEANVTIARAVAGETERERVLELIAKRGRALLGARTLAVLLAEGGNLVVASAAGPGAPEVGASVPLEGSLLGEVLASQQSERIAEGSSRVRARFEDLGVRPAAALLVPMVFRGRARGVLAAFDRDAAAEAEFDADDELVATSFAAAAAAAIFVAESVEAEKLKRSIEATEQERKRWARELHDETLQELGALSTILDAALRRPDEDGLRETVARATEYIQRSIDNIHALINELRPAALDDLGLKAALEALAERSAALHGLEVECELELDPPTDGTPPRSEELETAVYRLVQEALNNAIKHSGATRVDVRVVDDGEQVRASVSDDGSGFDPDRADRGFGLIGMRERASLIGGRVAIESRPGRGTTVRAELPALRVTDGAGPGLVAG